MIQFVNNVWYGDDTYNSNELKKISQEIREGNWQYKGSSGTIGDDNKFWYQPLTEQHTNFFRTITNNKVIRAYANGQTMTQHSGFHAVRS